MFIYIFLFSTSSPFRYPYIYVRTFLSRENLVISRNFTTKILFNPDIDIDMGTMYKCLRENNKKDCKELLLKCQPPTWLYMFNNL